MCSSIWSRSSSPEHPTRNNDAPVKGVAVGSGATSWLHGQQIARAFHCHALRLVRERRGEAHDDKETDVCGRFTLKARPAEVAKALGVPELLFEPRYNIFYRCIPALQRNRSRLACRPQGNAVNRKINKVPLPLATTRCRPSGAASPAGRFERSRFAPFVPRW